MELKSFVLISSCCDELRKIPEFSEFEKSLDKSYISNINDESFTLLIPNNKNNVECMHKWYELMINNNFLTELIYCNFTYITVADDVRVKESHSIKGCYPMEMTYTKSTKINCDMEIVFYYKTMIDDTL
jgi:hypothetical protein